MSKLARDRKKHWRIVKAVAKLQGMTLYEPKKANNIIKYPWIPISGSFASFIAQGLRLAIFPPRSNFIYFHVSNDEGESQLSGRSIDHIWFDEETIDAGQIIQDSILYDKNKPKE